MPVLAVSGQQRHHPGLASIASRSFFLIGANVLTISIKLIGPPLASLPANPSSPEKSNAETMAVAHGLKASRSDILFSGAELQSTMSILGRGA